MEQQNTKNCPCLVCTRTDDLKRLKSCWASIVKVVFYSLQTLFPNKEFFSLKRDVYPYVEVHRKLLSQIRLIGSKNWKKKLLDAISHTKGFVSLMDGSNGSWKMSPSIDPFPPSNFNPLNFTSITPKHSQNNSQVCLGSQDFDLDLDNPLKSFTPKNTHCMYQALNQYGYVVNDVETGYNHFEERKERIKLQADEITRIDERQIKVSHTL
ncbi:hypothetical protein EIN_184580 [Entamoeba invadens IP1]|uniref:hypothetical protein n=1 Tax=Entamoeba invadens IP1 TaxID=370355 RepID=UPI0002C3DC60|nr:hypothetical protein EIN_184580 [Entamoeba invadens IP1]ELP94101.1 hypothetical protein EIN_184580 [Entamoeba invadens IP1]|eukprot:XP_004260872.1 hypothetical protein EIN_184580 [Entamoeba invadens IP1]